MSPTLIHYHMNHSSFLLISTHSLFTCEKTGFYHSSCMYLVVQLWCTDAVALGFFPIILGDTTLSTEVQSLCTVPCIFILTEPIHFHSHLGKDLFLHALPGGYPILNIIVWFPWHRLHSFLGSAPVSMSFSLLFMH